MPLIGWYFVAVNFCFLHTDKYQRFVNFERNLVGIFWDIVFQVIQFAVQMYEIRLNMSTTFKISGQLLSFRRGNFPINAITKNILREDRKLSLKLSLRCLSVRCVSS